MSTTACFRATLVLLALLAGCRLPSAGQRGAAVVGAPVADLATAGTRTISAAASSARSVTPAVSHAAYEAPAEWDADLTRAAAEPAPPPEPPPLRLSEHAATSGSPQPPSAAEGPESAEEPPVAAAEEPAPAPSPASWPPVFAEGDASSDPFAGQPELSLGQLVAEVRARNPSLRAVSAAWQAAAERYPQSVSLDDPVLAVMIGPGGVGTDSGGGWMAQASQRLPWPGKRCLRGSVAAAEADALEGEVGDAQLRLAEAAKVAYADYFLAERLAHVNASTRALVEQLREIAVSKYQVNQVSQQDVLEAELELADLATRSAELTRDQQVAAARINTLLHRAADEPLPPPPQEMPMTGGFPAVEELQQAALGSRPDLYAQQARIRAEEANLALASREYYPDVNLVARYDGFMPEAMRPQVGVDVNLPIRSARRAAAVREACHRLTQRHAEYEDRLDQVRYEVQSAHSRAVQAAETVRLFRERTLPTAERSLRSAQANYTAGNLDFLRLLDAERQLQRQRERYYTAVAAYHQRIAELERVVAGSHAVASSGAAAGG